jgi:hypothetical protein
VERREIREQRVQERDLNLQRRRERKVKQSDLHHQRRTQNLRDEGK